MTALPTPKTGVSSLSSAFEEGDVAAENRASVEAIVEHGLTRAQISAFLAGEIDATSLIAPPWGPIGPEVYGRTYSRDAFVRDPETSEFILGEDGLKVLDDFWKYPRPAGERTAEVWADTARRVVLGNLGFAPLEVRLPDEAIDLFEMIYLFKGIPGGRHLWVTGTSNAFSRNCLAAETQVITDQGAKAIGDIVGQAVKVIDGNGGWVVAEAKAFGVQALQKITLARRGETKDIFATRDHGWFTAKKTGTGVTRVRTETQHLVAGDKLISVRAKSTPRIGGTRLGVSPVGVQHGFVFGDGTRTPHGSTAYFCGNKDAAMLKWFPNHDVATKANGVMYAGGNPSFFKDAPSISEAPSYLYGFLAGYFAADGCVDERGVCILNSASRADLLFVRDLCARLGIVTSGIRVQSRTGYGDQPTDQPTDLYRLTFDPHTLTEAFFLLPAHRERWLASGMDAPADRDAARWTVVSVEETHRIEEVYCFEIPTTHSFVLADNILTSNCFVAGWSPRTSDHFRFSASRLFEGGGVGANYSADLMAVTQPVVAPINVRVTIRPDHADQAEVKASAGALWVDYDSINDARSTNVFATTGFEDFIVVDQREGWVDLWVHLIDLACTPLPEGETHHHLLVDASDLRPHGAVLRTFGGRASGPAPLANAIGEITGVLNAVTAQTPTGRVLTCLEAMTLDHFMAASIVAGGARRSARMSIVRWDDPMICEFIECKRDQMLHWSTNISVEVDATFHTALNDASHPQHDLANRVLYAVALGMAANGEPGMVDTSVASVGEHNYVRVTNPCVTADTVVQTAEGLRRVGDLVGGGKVDLLVNDETWATTDDGFFQTGVQPVIKLDVDGTTLRVTPDHLISTPDGWKPAGDLSVGDVVDLTDSLGNAWGGAGTQEEGYLLGHLVGDGTFYFNNQSGVTLAHLAVWDEPGSEPVMSELLRCIEAAGLRHRSDWAGFRPTHQAGKEILASAALRDLAAEFGIVRGAKKISEEVSSASSDFITGFLRGLFDTDGHVEGDSNGGGLSVRLSQADRQMLGTTRTMLLALGIRSVVRREHPARTIEMPGGEYDSQESFRLIISGAHAERFAKLIGFVDKAKSAKLDAGIDAMTRGSYNKPMVGTVLAVDSDGVEAVYDCQVPGLNAFVANGTIVHNCGEIFLETDPADGAGESCNLGSINLDAYGTDIAGAEKAFRLMARFLYRATLNPYPDEAASRIEKRNRRIGVGLMGLHGWVLAHGLKLTELATSDVLKDKLVGFRKATRSAADEIADALGLPRSVKVTTVAPTGTISQMAGTTAGIHSVHAKYFTRRVRYVDSDPKLVELAAQGYTIVDDIYAAKTKVVEFPVKDALLDRFDEALVESASDISFLDFMSLVATIQNTFCGGTDGNAVSATATLPSPPMKVETDANGEVVLDWFGQPKQVVDYAALEASGAPAAHAKAMTSLLGQVKGITAFPEVSRDLSPIETISKADYELQVALLGTQQSGSSLDGECVGGACPVR